MSNYLGPKAKVTPVNQRGLCKGKQLSLNTVELELYHRGLNSKAAVAHGHKHEYDSPDISDRPKGPQKGGPGPHLFLFRPRNGCPMAPQKIFRWPGLVSGEHGCASSELCYHLVSLQGGSGTVKAYKYQITWMCPPYGHPPVFKGCKVLGMGPPYGHPSRLQIATCHG